MTHERVESGKKSIIIEKNDRGGYFEYGNFENSKFDTTGILKNLRLVSSKKATVILNLSLKKLSSKKSLGAMCTI